MNRKDIFKIWAPYNIRWTEYIKPVPFIGIDHLEILKQFIDYREPIIHYINEYKKDTALIIDEDGIDSIKEGISLAFLGYRPIPIFNGTNPNEDTLSIIDNESLEELLIWGAAELRNIELEDNAAPVFLLDRNRLNAYKMNRSVFDNSYDIYAQDMPTPEAFIKNKIKNIIIKGPKLNKDIAKVLYKHQTKGINIYYTEGYKEPKLVKLKRVIEDL